MSTSDRSPFATAYQQRNDRGTFGRLRRLVAGEPLRGLRELDDFQLRDIGASSDDIWRVHRLRNGERPTLLVG